MKAHLLSISRALGVLLLACIAATRAYGEPQQSSPVGPHNGQILRSESPPQRSITPAEIQKRSDLVDKPERLTASATSQSQHEPSEKTGGIGVALNQTPEGDFVIGKIIPKSPADETGKLRPGDRIISVGSREGSMANLRGLKLTEVVALLRGEEGSAVNLYVVPFGRDNRDGYNLTITRRVLVPLQTETQGRNDPQDVTRALDLKVLQEQYAKVKTAQYEAEAELQLSDAKRLATRARIDLLTKRVGELRKALMDIAPGELQEHPKATQK